MNRIAKLISAILNPSVIIIVMSFALTLSLQWAILTFTIVLIQAIAIWILVKKKVFSDFDVSIKKQRPILHLMSLTSALIYLTIIYFLHAPIILIAQTLIVISVFIALFLVNKFTKASGHIAVLSAAIVMLVAIYGWLYLLGFILVGVLAWSRLRLKRHSFKEVIVGAIIGIIFSALIIVI